MMFERRCPRQTPRPMPRVDFNIDPMLAIGVRIKSGIKFGFDPDLAYL